MLSFSWLDYVLLGIVVLSAAISLLRGFIREALALVGWVAAVWIAISFSQPLANLFTSSIELPSMRLALAYLLLFIGTLVVSGILVWLVGMLVEKTGLSGTDRLLGVIFGLARGVIIAAILVLLAGLTPMPKDPWWRQAVLVPHFQVIAEQLRAALPSEVARYINFSPAKSPSNNAGLAPAVPGGQAAQQPTQ